MALLLSGELKMYLKNDEILIYLLNIKSEKTKSNAIFFLVKHWKEVIIIILLTMRVTSFFDSKNTKNKNCNNTFSIYE